MSIKVEWTGRGNITAGLILGSLFLGAGLVILSLAPVGADLLFERELLPATTQFLCIDATLGDGSLQNTRDKTASPTTRPKGA